MSEASRTIRPRKEHLNIVHHHLRRLWARIGFSGLGIICGLLIVYQMVQPWDKLPLYSTIDGTSVGGLSAVAVVKDLDSHYKKLPIALYFGDSSKAYRQPFPEDIGLKISSQPQVDAKAYPLWLRLIPTSWWWAHMVLPTVQPAYQRDGKKAEAYVTKELGQSCDVTAQNASLAYKDKKLQVVDAIDGGTCKLGDVQKLLANTTPQLDDATLRIPMKQRPARIHNDEAKTYASQLNGRTKSLVIKAGSSEVAIPQETFLAWLDFAAPNTGLTATVNADRAAEFLEKELGPKVYIKPGVSQVKTTNFTETSRIDGAEGRALDNQATIQIFNDWIADAEKPLVVQIKAVAATANYSRSYTPDDEGMSALIAQFAQSHAGSFGVSYTELDGSGRRASYQGSKSFRTASTYKLFVAFGTLKRIEAGQWRWSDQIDGGRDLTKCFDDMIVKSDNPCAEALLGKIGYRTLTNEIRAAGLSNSGFLGDFPVTTADDLTTFVGSLQAGQLLSPSSTNTLLSAMKRNIYRQGIPAGASGPVGDKVGFLYAFLHDASIVYSPKGTYALTIMTEGSSWATVADLTRQIENLRSQG